MSIVRVAITAAGMGFLALACSSAAVDEQAHDVVSVAPGNVAIAATTTVPPGAIEAVDAACKGTYSTSGACMSCVDKTATQLQKSGQITGKQKDALEASFAANECKNKCIPTTCSSEGATCGTIDDGCGGTLTCGSACVTGTGPNWLVCICADGTQTNTCTTEDCYWSADQDRLCGITCADHGGETGAGCLMAAVGTCPQ